MSRVQVILDGTNSSTSFIRLVCNDFINY